MNIDYTKLLPFQLRSTRWAELLTVVGSVLEDVKVNNIDIIKTQNIIMSMTDEQLLSFAQNFGYSIITLDGYTGTLDYLRKEVYTIIPRILTRNTIPGYNLIFTIFNLNGHVYPTIYDSETLYLTAIEDWTSSSESTSAYDTLDAGGDFSLFYLYDRLDRDWSNIDDGKFCDSYTIIYDNPQTSDLIDTTLDAFEFPTLDVTPVLDTITRHLIINYSFIYIENTSEFLSDDTLRALYVDIQNNKRRTEVVYYEPVITLTTNSDNTLTTETIYNYDHSINTTKQSILVQPGIDLSNAYTVRFGDSSHDTIDGTITDVKHLIASINISDCDITNISAIELIGRRKITQKCKFSNFSELALLDSTGTCIYYATFPQIRYLSYMYSNIGFNISLV
jgi:hypothetical protein